MTLNLRPAKFTSCKEQCMYVGTLPDLFVEINSPDIAVADVVLTDMPGPVFVGPKPSLLVGVKLPRSKSEWTMQTSSFVHS